MPVTAICAHHGISRKTFYKWRRRYQEGGRNYRALRDRSRRPRSHPKAIPKATVELILALRPPKADTGPAAWPITCGTATGCG